MGVLPDWRIKQLAENEGMIDPFDEGHLSLVNNQKGMISFGATSYGYDIRVGRIFRLFDLAWYSRQHGGLPLSLPIINPKAPETWQHMLRTIEADILVIPPNSFALAETVEKFKIPRNILAVCVGKSTYARCGQILNVTPAEPEWGGRLTLEISNTTPLPAMVFANEGIGQLLFVTGDQLCAKSYKDKRGKYQDQPGLTLPFVR